MEAMRKSWTDDRLDALNEKVDRRFDETDRRFDETDRRFDETDRRLEGLDRRLDRIEDAFQEFRVELREQRSTIKSGLESMQRHLLYVVVTLASGMVAGFAAMVGLVTTQL